MEKVKSYLQQKISEDRIVCYTLGIYDENGDSILFSDGFSSLEPKKIKAQNNTIYDLASITKPLVTSSIVLKLYEEGLLSLNDNLSKFFKNTPDEKSNITILNLLTHTSGIIDWEPLYKDGKGFLNILNSALNSRMVYKIGEKVNYSCINYVLLKGIIEKVCKKDYKEIAEELLFNPSRADDLYFNPPGELLKRISPTEKGNVHEKKMAKELFGIELENRDYLIWGEVHDGNSFYGGGTSGNAGLFATVESTKKLMEFIMSDKFFKKEETLKLLIEKDFSPKKDPVKRSTGFILKKTESAYISSHFSEKAFYHRGFTGTSITVDPVRGIFFILHTNRVHPYVRESVRDIIKETQEIFFENYY